MHRRWLLTAALSLALAAPALSPALAQTPKRIRGTITAMADHTLTVATTAGETVKITLTPDYTVGAIVPTTLDKVQAGSKIGIVGVGPAKQQRALVVSIFPPGATVNEAQFAWDSVPDSLMTNAPVTSDVTSTDGRVLTVTVKGEPIQVTTNANTIVQTSEPGTPAMLVPGAKVLIFATQAADGTLSAPRVNVGKDGYTPAN